MSGLRGLAMGFIVLSLAGAAGAQDKTAGQDKAATFGDDLAFLKQYMKPIVLTDKGGAAQVIVLAELQGRVMTSTAEGTSGASFGWINREHIAAAKPREHFNPYGGEDRFWLGPEGGQFSIFFAPKAAFDLDHWYVPKQLDTEPFDVAKQADDRVTFQKKFELTNYSGTKFNVQVDREIRLLPADQAWQHLGVPAAKNVKLVAYESENTLTNAGKEPWKKETGLLSIWILGMFNAAPGNTVAIPIKPGPEAELGPSVNADYFGAVPPERLQVKDGTVFFSADGNFRSKIGISPKRAKPILGSYDAGHKVLTLVQYTLPKGAGAQGREGAAPAEPYVNSQWKIQDNPFAGDVANSYNDGPPKPGEKQLGKFYELESSSPAAALQPGAKITHVQRTIHITGPEAELNKLAQAALGVGLEQITTALPKPSK